MSDVLPHAVNAPEELRAEANAEMKVVREVQKPDSLGRINWLEVSKKMSAWWKEKGFTFP